MPMKPEFPNLLQPGFHQFALTDLHDKFVMPFPASIRRQPLLDGLLSFIQEMKSLAIAGELWFDGSFITEKLDPDDVDLVLVLEENSVNSLTAIEQKRLARLLHNPSASMQYHCDVYCVLSNDIVMISYWRGWYGFKRDGKTPKGIGLIEL